MHPQQKAAWFILTVIGGILVLYAAAVPAFSWWFHRTMAEIAAPALGLFGLLGLTGFAALFYRPSRDGIPNKQPVMDERDLLLLRRAWSAGMKSFWIFFYAAGMGTWAYLYFVRGLEKMTVPIGILPAMITAGFIVFMLAQSLATLHYYGWKPSDAGR